MTINLPGSIGVLFQNPWVQRIRRNHGLEHATLNVLAKRNPNISLAGHTDLGGFWILGDIDTPELKAAVEQALRRLNAGDKHLAVHPNCGTNLAVAGLLSTLAGLLGMVGAGRRLRDKLERLPFAVALATLALMLARPLGLILQANITTSADMTGLTIAHIRATQRGWVRAHRVQTQG
jgi:hypothetical protein